jgi:hypothetical protein
LVVAVLVFLVALGGNRSPAHDILVHRSLNVRLGLIVLLVLLAGSFLVSFGTLVYVCLGNVTKQRSDPGRRKLPAAPWWANAVSAVIVLALIGGVVLIGVVSALLVVVVLATTGLRVPGSFTGAIIGSAAAVLLLAIPWLLARARRPGGHWRARSGSR